MLLRERRGAVPARVLPPGGEGTGVPGLRAGGGHQGAAGGEAVLPAVGM